MNANPSLRMIAFLVDLLIYVAIWVFLFFNLHLGDYLSWLLASGYLLVKDGLLHGQSLGKVLVRLRVVNVKKEPISLMDSLKRNGILVIPNFVRFLPFWGSFLLIVLYLLECYLMYTQPDGKRWGDQFSQTTVVQV
ncbi:RDD family protein [candidate division KSB1 bacterium]|nr:RDD family protein [candidate division KSB1 bacterium]